MAYGKTGYRKKTYRRRRTYRRAPTTSYIRQVAARTMRRMSEHKMINISEVREPSSDLERVVHLNTCRLGDDIGNRTGRLITMTSVQLNMVLKNTSLTTQTVRCVLLYDKTPQEGLITSASVYDTSTIDFVDGAPRLIDNRYRFLVLRDWLFTMASADTEDVSSNKIIRYYRKLGLKTQYDAGDAGSYADFRRGALVLLYNEIADVDVHVTTRVRFIDN